MSEVCSSAEQIGQLASNPSTLDVHVRALGLGGSTHTTAQECKQEHYQKSRAD